MRKVLAPLFALILLSACYPKEVEPQCVPSPATSGHPVRCGVQPVPEVTR